MAAMRWRMVGAASVRQCAPRLSRRCNAAANRALASRAWGPRTAMRIQQRRDRRLAPSRALSHIKARSRRTAPVPATHHVHTSATESRYTLHNPPLTHLDNLGLALLGAASLAHAAPNCTIKLKGNDQMQFDLKTVTVSAACPSITIELIHTGKLAAQVMGHNVVVSKTADVSAISAAGMKAGGRRRLRALTRCRVLAATPVIGGGASTKAKLAGSKLQAGGDYTYFCSFPGHSGIMKGTLVVTK